MAVGEWSPQINAKFKLKDGREQEGRFRCKLLELSDDGEGLRLYISNIAALDDWCSPREIVAELKSEEGILGAGVHGYAVGWFDLDTFAEINELHTKWLEDIASTLLSKHEWDIFFMHAHSPDWAYHVMLTEMDPNTNKDEVNRKAAWDAHLRIYEAQDKMIAKIMETVGKDALVILVSDHGAVADGPVFDTYKILADAGLIVMESNQLEITTADVYAPVGSLSMENLANPDKTETKRLQAHTEGLIAAVQFPDVQKSRCFPQRSLYVYINLKGRDPEGIVEPADYETVQRQIIDALLTYVDPNTGKRPVSLALSKRDARILGLYGDAVGDVVYALYPWFSGQHGNILPGAEWGIGSLKGLLSLSGPGIKKGYIMERTCNLVDIVPTICYLMDLPLPAQVEGGIIYQALKDPDFKMKEINKLKEGLSRMETALQRGERQPWDKHECA